MNNDTTRQRIEKRIAVKDAMMFTLNASNAASAILAAFILVTKNPPKNVIQEFESIRDELLASNLAKVEELKGADEEPSNVPF